MLTNTGEEGKNRREREKGHRQVEEQRPEKMNRGGGRGENKHKEAKKTTRTIEVNIKGLLIQTQDESIEMNTHTRSYESGRVGRFG